MTGHGDSFNIYLPSNSAGAQSMSESESSRYSVSSWYKTTLDQTYELDGDSWEVGLAEVCFPSALLSNIDEDFVVGIRIMNPIKNWQKSVRQSYINTFVPGLKPDDYKINTTFDYLDEKFECVGLDPTSTKGLNFFSKQDPEAPAKQPSKSKPEPRPDFIIKKDKHGREIMTVLCYMAGFEPENNVEPSTQAFIPMASLASSSIRGSSSTTRPVHDTEVIEGAVDAETATGSHNPHGNDTEMIDSFIEGYTIKKYYYKRRLFEIDAGKYIDIENCDMVNLAIVKGGFFSTRSELVNILNQRLLMLLHNRTFPGTWANALVEPQFVIKDTGLVKIACGFHESFSGATSNSLYLVPTISSLKVLQFLGLDLSNWKKDETIGQYVYTVKTSTYNRRDSQLPMIMTPTETRQKSKLSTEAITTFESGHRQMLMDWCWTFMFENFEKPFRRQGLRLSQDEILAMIQFPKFKNPQFIFVQSDIAAPVAIGNSRASILRITTLRDTTEQSTASIVHKAPEKYIKIFFAPIARRAFNSIEVFLSDENGSELVFDQGTVYVVLEFRKRSQFSLPS